MGCKRGQRSGQVRLAATWTGNRIAITNQLLELGTTIFTNVFKDRHFTDFDPPCSVCTILAQRGREWGWREGSQVLADLVTYLAKESEAVNFTAVERGGILERVMNRKSSGKERAIVFGVIANG